MSSNKGDQPPPGATGEPDPPDTTSGSSADSEVQTKADIKPPTVSGTSEDTPSDQTESEPPIIVQGGSGAA